MSNGDTGACSATSKQHEHPLTTYHYHLTEDSAPYSIDCFRGVIDCTGAGGFWWRSP